jgi:hypothetical protein
MLCLPLFALLLLNFNRDLRKFLDGKESLNVGGTLADVDDSLDDLDDDDLIHVSLVCIEARRWNLFYFFLPLYYS